MRKWSPSFRRPTDSSSVGTIAGQLLLRVQLRPSDHLPGNLPAGNFRKHCAHFVSFLSSNLIKFSRIICVISSDLIKNFVTTSSAIFCRQCLSYGRCNLWHFHDGLILHLHRSLWNYESLPQLHRNKVCFVAPGPGCFSFSFFFFWCVGNDII